MGNCHSEPEQSSAGTTFSQNNTFSQNKSDFEVLGYYKRRFPHIDIKQAAQELLNLPGGEEILVSVGIATLRARNVMMMEGHQLSTMVRSGFHGISGIYFNPKFPFISPLRLNEPSQFRKESYCFLYYILDVHRMAFCFSLLGLKRLLYGLYHRQHYCRHYIRFFELFMLVNEWAHMVESLIAEGRSYGVLVLGRQFHTQHVTGEIVYTFEWIHFRDNDFFDEYKQNQSSHKWFKKRMMQFNGLHAEDNDPLLRTDAFDENVYPNEYQAKVASAAVSYADRHDFGWSRHSSEEDVDDDEYYMHLTNGNDSDPIID